MKHIGSIKNQIEAVDPLSGFIAVRSTQGRCSVIQQDNRTILQRTQEPNNTIGYIVSGCSWAGSIWMGSQCIGEYERQGAVYKVTPIEDHNKKPESVLPIHPVDYLLEKVESQPTLQTEEIYLSPAMST